MTECIGKYYYEDNDFKDISFFEEAKIQTRTSFYEVIRVIDGVCLFFNEHITRLKNSVRLSGLRFSTGSGTLFHIIKELLYRNDLQTGNIKLVVHFARNHAPFLINYVIQHFYPTSDMYLQGVETALYKIERENPNIKRFTPELQKKLNEFISEKKIFEAFLVGENGYITEGSKSNLFFIIKGTLFTAPDEAILKGITRDKIIMLCKKLNYNLIVKSISIKDLNKVEAAFITGTSPGVLPVSKIDHLKLEVSNPFTLTLKNEYDTLIRDYIDRYRKKN
jgi:branched-chain amino acid aminotransferase